MANIIDWLKDRKGNKVIPKTLTKAVQDENGQSLDSILSNLPSGGGGSFTGDSSDNTVTFTQATTRENIITDEKHSTIFGKIAKWFADLKTIAFTGNLSDATGTLAVAKGGTGATDAATARTNLGVAASNHSHSYIPLSGSTGITGVLRTTGELQSTTANGLRLVQGNYGAIFRNDGSYFYILGTNSGDSYGSWARGNDFCVNLANGNITIGNGLTVNNGLTSSGATALTTATVNTSLAVGSSAGRTPIACIKCGSTTVSVSNTNYAQLATASNCTSWYSGYNGNRAVFFICDGDDGSNNVHFESCTLNPNNGVWYVQFNSDWTGTARINWMCVMW